MKSHPSFLVQAQYLTFGAGAVLLALLSPLNAQQTVPQPLNAYPQGASSPQNNLGQQMTPCRQLGKKDTVVIIEASNNDRMQKVNQVVSQHNLKGDYCTSRRTGRTVWMSSQLSSVDTAVKVFDYFRSVGLISPVNPNGNGDSLRNGASSPSSTPSF
ncbi:hypothetical protein K9N68_07965 [Kovacikia minuta CCNUW1]|uniref:hypothetical protein n=1 Tax=Kovacikia minuta TaxID=2931930 RepID=UPI001CCD60C1|nr:hypothetical protein [Kovacikia minuta]UBF27830.1 hypothetical protein K9N68_07965 [Kovacikia minuta CCNUW1]